LAIVTAFADGRFPTESLNQRVVDLLFQQRAKGWS